MTAKLGRADWRGVRPDDLVLLASGNWNWANALIENGCFSSEARRRSASASGRRRRFASTRSCVARRRKRRATEAVLPSLGELDMMSPSQLG